MAENPFTSLAGADGRHRTYCRLCEAQCGMIAHVREGRIERLEPDRDHPVSEGHVCIKGTRSRRSPTIPTG